MLEHHHSEGKGDGLGRLFFRLLPDLSHLVQVRYQAQHTLGLKEEHVPGLASVDRELVAVPEQQPSHHGA